MRAVSPVSEFADVEKLLGQEASNGCIRLSREKSRRLIEGIEEQWRTYSLIVYFYDQPEREEIPSKGPRYLLFMILQEGRYTCNSLAQEQVPSIQGNETAPGVRMSPGSFDFTKTQTKSCHLSRASMED